MATLSSNTCPRCKANLVAGKIFCMSCGAPVAKSSPKTPAPPPSQSVSPAKPAAAPPPAQRTPVRQAVAPSLQPTTSTGQITLLTCKNCGGQLDYSPGSSVASCPFCGGKTLVGTPTTEMQRLRDLDGLAMQIVHYQSQLTPENARQALVAAMKADSASIRNPDGIAMQISTVFYPAWRVNVQAQCAWQGRYEEKRAVTKYRTVTKYSGSQSYQQQEAYTDYESIWHPCNGTEFLQVDLHVPAAPGISMAQLQVATKGCETFSPVDGAPQTVGRFASARPSLSQARVWQDFDCDAAVQSHAYAKCIMSGMMHHTVDHVSQNILSRTFSLVYFPMAVVSYNVAGGEYRHFVSLLNGDFSGDLPKDLGALKNEGASAREMDKKFIRTANIIAWTAIIVGALTLPVAWDKVKTICSDSPDSPFGELLVYGILCLIGFGTAINRFNAIKYSGDKNWRAFLTKRGPALVRVLLNPPPHLAQMKTVISAQQLAPLKKAADDNTLEAVMSTREGQQVADAIAKVVFA